MTNYENIPEELKNLPQWVCSRSDTKIPMQATENAVASSTNPSTWSTFDTAHNAVSEGYYDYCGFVFADNGIVGIDIDSGYCEDGLINPLAADIIGKCASYTEKSKSGRGFHILLRGTLPFKGKNNLAGVEIYRSARYFIMTGNTLLFRTIEDNQEAIDYIVDKYFPDSRPDKNISEYGNRIYSPVWQLPTGNNISLKPIYPSILSGSRNISLTSLAGQLHSVGYSFDDIRSQLVLVNKEQCKPPLDNREVLTIIRSVTRYRR